MVNINELFKPEMTPELRLAFYDFISHIKIDSKELGGDSPLVPYRAQTRFLDELFDGLEEDIHWFVVLKARQLGISTISLALDIFWLSVFPGLQGALVADTDANKENMRITIKRMMASLPKSHAIPTVQNNRYGLQLRNGSTLAYLVAGVRKNSGLGRSRGLNFVHATECSSWGDQAGLESLTKSLGQRYPARLYIWESTAQGFNLFYNMWEEAKRDELIKKGIFIGWWAKETYAFDEGTPLYQKYAEQEPSKDEKEKMELVKVKYNFDVGMDQLAWYRHEKDPSGSPDAIEEETLESEIFQQELPWDEDEAFIQTNVGFFPPSKLSESLKRGILTSKYLGYRYYMGNEFTSTKIEQVRVDRLAHLKIFEEPDPSGIYTIGADAAFGSSDKADRNCAQVVRCYADKVVQVAEFCDPLMGTREFAWVVSHLCGAYGNARLLLEINGPGEAVFNEMKNLQLLLQNGYLANVAEEKGLKDIFRNVRKYLYHRIDSMGGGASYHWKTTGANKAGVMNQLRDVFNTDQIVINSVACLREMQRIVQVGLVIEGEGVSKDDRVIALALAVRAWMDQERYRLQLESRTFENESRKGQYTSTDLAASFYSNIMRDFFNRQEWDRKQALRASRRRR